jgi:hypothetical protein
MLNRIGIALGAGIASALLFIVTAQGTVMAMALAYLAPLPIMIATLGWGIDAGAIALAVSCATVAGAIEPLSGLLFGLTIALPSWALAALAHLTSIPIFRRSAEPTPSTRVRVGGLVVTAATLGALISVGALISMIVVYGGYEKGVEGYTNLLQPAIEEALGGSLSLPEDFSIGEVVGLVVKYSPAAISASTTLMLLVNLYAAARSAQMSQRLNRPWPDVPNSLVLPPLLGLAAIVAVAVWLTAPEPASQFAVIFVGALGVAYVLQGLAALHALSRSASARPFLIVALYLACVVEPRFVLPAIALVGLIESAASLRARAAAHPFQT